MFNRKLKQQIAALEKAVLPLITERNCARRVHEWEIFHSNTYSNDAPYVRCKHCYRKPEIKS